MNITTDTSINPAEDLPELPEGVDTPTVTFDFGTDDAKLYTYLHFGDGEEPVVVHFWMNDEGEAFNSHYQGGEELPWEGDDLEAVLEYGSAVTGHIASKIGWINDCIARGDTHRQIVDAALGRRGGYRITVPAYLVEVGDTIIGDNGGSLNVDDIDDSPSDPTMVYFDTEFGRIYREKNYEVTVIRR